MRLRVMVAVALLAVVSPCLVEAQSITGTVRQQTTGSPVEAAQVFLEGINLGGLTQSNGQYLIVNVPLGTHTLTVQSLGYRTESVTVTVAAGQTVTQNIFLSQQALQLDEVVVTGTAAASRVREIGNSVAVLDASIAEVQPITNVSDLLRGRVAGVVLQQGTGDAGTASTIKIRGSSTMRTVNDGPLIYIDGIRVSNRMESGPSRGSDVSRIDDMDPAMIESIEIIKGPAAATLYGTEAANGVINIKTKRGAIGAAQWNFTTRQGTSWFANPAGRTPTNWGVNPNTGNVETLNILENQVESDLIFRNARSQYYGIDVSGGNAAFRYFVSGSAALDEGVTFNNAANRYNTRINVFAQPNDQLTIQANAGIGLSRIALPTDYPYEEAVYAGPADLARTPDRRGYRRAVPEARYEREHNNLNSERTTVGATATHTPFDWFTQKMTFGLDLTNQAEDQYNKFLSPEFAQYFSTNTAAGSRRTNRETVIYTTFDYAASATRDLTSSIASTTSGGFQVYTRSVRDLTGSGSRFPALGLSAITATGTGLTPSDGLVENNTVGVYLQQQIGFNDRLFITGALRADDNSSFGQDFDLVYYPKLSASWVLSEEPFWGLDMFDQFRLRAAYGESGQQPDAFDALRSYGTRLSAVGGATVTPRSPGNSTLGPERGVEYEAGFDASFASGRVTLDFTYYDQKTKDAIVSRPVPPSQGFDRDQFVNIGEVHNRGVEVSLGARIIQSQALSWDLNFNLATNRNRVTDLGLPGNIELGWSTRHQQGYPVGSMFAPQVIFAEFVGDTDEINRETMRCDNGSGQPIICDTNAWIYQGHPDPNYEASLISSFTIGDRLTISGLVQGKIGQTKYDLQGWWRYAGWQQTELNLRPREFVARGEAVGDGGVPINEVAEAQYGASGEFALWINEASFIRFKELSVSYLMPESWAQALGATRGTINIASRNLGMIWTNWQEWPHHDPEVVDPTSTFSGNREPQQDTAIPPVTSLTLTVRLSR